MLTQIKKARMVAGMDQKQLAKAMGVSQVSVSAWETGKSLPKPGRLMQLATVLNTSVEKLLEDAEGVI